MAKIGLEDVRFNAPHGFYAEEHLTGNEFSIDVWVEIGISGAAAGDDLGKTVSYSTIYYLLQAEMKKPAQLLETLAQRMVDRILEQFSPRVSGVTLKLRKLNPPLGGQVAAAFVEVSSSSGSGITRPDKEKDVYDEEEDEGEYYEDDEGYDDYEAY